MRRSCFKTFILLPLAIMFMLAPASAVFAAYSIPADVISGGGSTSSGGTYVLTGTVGQSSPIGVSSGGSYINYGGFIYRFSANSLSEPVADAGPDQLSATIGPVQLDGSGSTGGSLTYNWSVTRHPAGIAGVTLAGTTITIGGGPVSGTGLDMPVFSAATSGVYEFSLVASNPHPDSPSAPDYVTIAVDNTAPIADAGPEKNGVAPGTVQLDGTASFDLDGDSIITYEWAVTSVPGGVSSVNVNGVYLSVGGATLIGTSLDGADRPVFSPDQPGPYTFSLTVSDGVLWAAKSSYVYINVYVDADGDGMGDTWEVNNFLDTTSRDGTGDANGNGVSDLNEYINNTNPVACYWTGTEPDLDTCVSHSVVLANCLNEAQNDFANNDIMVERGTYTGNFLYDSDYLSEDYALALYGGYDPGCSGSVVDPTQTIIDGNSTGTALALYSNYAGPNASIYVEGFRITNGFNQNPGGCVDIYSALGGIDLFGNIVDNCESFYYGGGVSIYADSAPTYLINNIIYGNHAAFDGGGLLFQTWSGLFNLINNTISDNTSDSMDVGGGVTAWIGDGTIASADITNNIIWGNTSPGGNCADADIDSDYFGFGTYGAVTFKYNDVNLATGVCFSNPEDVLDPSNIEVDPLFLDPLGGDYRIAYTSPVAEMGDSAHPSLPLIDIEGDPRIMDAYVDMGADESSPPAVAPASITNPATNETGSYIVSWGSSTTPGAIYVLEESTEPGFAGATVVYTGTDLITTITGRTDGSYYYRVKATAPGYLDSLWTVCAAPTVVTIPTAPADAPNWLWNQATSATDKVSTDWDDSTTPGVTYELYEATLPDFSNEILAYSGTASAAVLSNRSAGTYYYRVKATKIGYFDSAWAVGPAGGCEVLPPSTKPFFLYVQPTSTKGTIPTDWNGPAGATYRLEEATDPAFSDATQVYQGTASEITLYNRPNGTYYYRVRALQAGKGWSAWMVGASNTCTVTLTLKDITWIYYQPSSPSGFYIVDWGDSNSGVTYELEEDTDPGFSNPQPVYSGPQSFYTFTSHANGTYYYRVRATRTGWVSSNWYEGTSSIVVFLKVWAPTWIYVQANSSSGSIPVDWGNSRTSGVTYELYEATLPDFSDESLVYSDTASDTVLTGRTNGTYYYRVRATRSGFAPSDWLEGPNPCVVNTN